MKTNLFTPPPAEKVRRVQLVLSGTLAAKVKDLMDKYGLKQAVVVRMLIVDGLEARDHRYGLLPTLIRCGL